MTSRRISGTPSALRGSRRSTGVTGLLVVILVAAVPTGSHAPQPDPVVRLVVVSAALRQRPAQWVRRPLRVQAIVLGGGRWASAPGTTAHVFIAAPPRLADPDGRASFALIAGPINPVLAFLRQVPWVGAWIPPSQVAVVGTLHVYRIQLEVCPDHNHAYQAILLDLG